MSFVDVTKIGSIDNPKLRIDSIAVYTRALTTTSTSTPSTPAHHLSGSSHLNLVAGESLQNYVYMGSSDGCITLFTGTISAPGSAGGENEIVLKRAQKRSLEVGEGAVSFVHVEKGLREPRVLVLCNSKVMMLHHESLDRLHVFQNYKALDGAVACCVSSGLETPKLAAIVKRQVILVEFSDSSCSPYVGTAEGNITVSESASHIGWHHQVIIVGGRKEYSLYNARTHQLIDQLFVDKMATGPVIRTIPFRDGVVAIRLPEKVIFYDGKRRAPLESATWIPFSETVVDVLYSHPFLVGITASGKLLARSVHDDQEVTITGSPGTTLRCADAGPLCIFAASQRDIYSLCVSPLQNIIHGFVKTGAFDRAVQHYESSFHGSDAAFENGMKKVHRLCAEEAFSIGNFSEAFHHFSAADEDPQRIIGLVSQLQRPSVRESLADDAVQPASPLSQSVFSGSPDGYELCYRYFRQRRVVSKTTTSSSGQTVSSSNYTGSFSSPTAGASAPAQQAPAALVATDSQKAVDFAIFVLLAEKCVKYTSDEVSELFLPSCALDYDECLPYITSASTGEVTNASFMCLLLSACGKHKKALDLCKKMNLVEEAVIPLQLAEDQNLFVQHLPWMLLEKPLAAVRACASKQKHPPEPKLVIPLLRPFRGEPLHRYLKFLVYTVKDRDSEVHTSYALNLIHMVKLLVAFEEGTTNELRMSAGEESGVLGDLRKSLIMFLKASNLYDSDTILTRLLEAKLLREQVAVHARNKDHASALVVVVYGMGSVPLAETYCNDLHDAATTQAQHIMAKSFAGKDVADEGIGGFSGGSSATDSIASPKSALSAFKSATMRVKLGAKLSGAGSPSSPLSLAKKSDGGSFGSPAASSVVGGSSASGGLGSGKGQFNDFYNVLLRVLLVPPPGETQRLNEALELLERQSRRINPIAVMQLMPSEVCVSKLSPYLTSIFQTVEHKRSILSVTEQCGKSQHDASSKFKSVLQQRFVIVDDARLCVVCKKPLGDAVFGIFPNLKVAHFRCFKQKEIDPERGVPFRAEL